MGIIAVAAVLTCAAGVGALVLYVKTSPRRARSETPFQRDQLAEEFVNRQRNIIKYHDPETGKIGNPQEQLEARTQPNERLKRVFGIDNAFTTDSRDCAIKFVTQAKKILRQAIGLQGLQSTGSDAPNWTPLIESIREAVKDEFKKGQKYIALAQLVQVVTLKVSLKYLFDLGDESLADRQALILIAAEINDLWLRSKHDDTIEWKGQTQMHQSLRAITDQDQDPLHPVQNPMNFILPAYETMWRAVFRGIMELSFRPYPEAAKWKQLLTEITNDPFKANWKSAADRKQICALDVVKEILRLYPPTRRVHRYFPNQPEYSKADLEECHRNKNLVTEDADIFEPGRWAAIRETYARCLGKEINNLTDKEIKIREEDDGFMPFALTCPAGKEVAYGFGFKMIALLVGMLSEQIDGLKDWELVIGEEKDRLPAVGTALNNEREHYLSLVYKVKE